LANSYRDLLVWKKAKALSVAVYKATENFPDRERFGLTNQMRRSAVSVPSSVAEGHGRGTRRDFANFLCVARGSLQELETQVDIAIDLGFGDANELLALHRDCFHILGLLNRLLKAINLKAKA
jgi:four helix bundle protein